jgi:hypothetical protein
MGFIHGKRTAVFLGGHDLSEYLNDSTKTQTVEVADSTTYGRDDKVYVAGLADGMLSAAGLFDGAETDGVDAVIAEALASDGSDIVTYCPDSAVVGRVAYSCKALRTKYDVNSPLGDVVAVSLDVQADGGIDRGFLLAAGPLAATGNGTGVDNGAATTAGGVGYLHATANSRDGASTLKVQHSVDNSVYVDLVTFAAVPAATQQGERVVFGGTVNRYLRAVRTLAGSTGTITAAVTFARN